MKSPLLASLLLVHFYLEASTQKPLRISSKKQKDSKQTSVITLTLATLDATLSDNLAVVLVTSDWCAWCTKMKPIFEESFKKEKDRATYAYLPLGKSFNPQDIDPRLKQVEQSYGIHIKALPTILVFKNKKLVEHIAGSQTKEQLTALVKKHSIPENISTSAESSKPQSATNKI